MRSSKSPFESYKLKWILFFTYLICSSVSSPKALKTCLRFAIFNFSEKLQNIFKIGLKNMEWLYKNRSPTKNIWKEKNLQTCFCCLYEKLTTVQIWGQTNKFPLTCSFQKGPKRWFGHSHLEVMKNSTIISFSLKILDI